MKLEIITHNVYQLTLFLPSYHLFYEDRKLRR
jgi:hypothetical protein